MTRVSVIKTGSRFGRWEVVDGTTPKQLLCKCDCGTLRILQKTAVLSGRTTSCGCGRADTMRKRSKTHGHFSYGKMSPTYRTWTSMKQRCKNKNHTFYQYYGGRGIIYDERWEKFENFLEDMGERPEGMTLDRINSDGNYCKTNCKWSSSVEQANNRSSNNFITYKNERYTIAGLCRIHKVNPRLFRTRVFQSGWSIDDALQKKLITKRTRNSDGTYAKH